MEWALRIVWRRFDLAITGRRWNDSSCHKISCFSALIFDPAFDDPAFDPAEVVGEAVCAGAKAQSASEASRDKNGKRIFSLPKVE